MSHTTHRPKIKSKSASSSSPEAAALSETAQVDRLEELRQIELAHNGVDFSASAWVIQNSAEYRPWSLPASFAVSKLSPAELRAAMSLGLLRIDLLTSDIQSKLRESPATGPISSDEIQAVLSKYAKPGEAGAAH